MWMIEKIKREQIRINSQYGEIKETYYFDIMSNLLTITFAMYSYEKFYKATLNSKLKCNLYLKVLEC